MSSCCEKRGKLAGTEYLRSAPYCDEGSRQNSLSSLHKAKNECADLAVARTMAYKYNECFKHVQAVSESSGCCQQAIIPHLLLRCHRAAKSMENKREQNSDVSLPSVLLAPDYAQCLHYTKSKLASQQSRDASVGAQTIAPNHD